MVFSLARRLLRRLRRRLPLPFLVLPLLVPGLLSGCTQNLFGGRPPRPAAAAARPPGLDPGLGPGLGLDEPYRLRRDDKVSLSVWDHAELSVGSIHEHYSSTEAEGKWLLVDAQGAINAPRVGRLLVAGLTLPEAEQRVAQALGKWLLNPQPTLRVLNLAATVLGEVNQPGRQPLAKARTPLVEVLGQAGDLGAYADKRHIQLLRPAAAGIQVVEVDLTQLGALDRGDLLVVPGDVVYVPARNGKQFDRKAPTVLGVTSLLSTVLLLTRLLLLN